MVVDKLRSPKPLHYQPDNFYNTTNIGSLSLLYSNCGALTFDNETDSLCCSKGNVEVDDNEETEFDTGGDKVGYGDEDYEGYNSDNNSIYGSFCKTITVFV